MSGGVLESHALKATIWRRGRPPLVFGLGRDAHSDLRAVTIARTLGQPATVSLVLPGRSAPGGGWWANEIAPMDAIQVSAAVSRNPARLSQPWRTLFFGVVRAITRGFQVGQGEYGEDSVLVATCTLGALEVEGFNWWAGASGTFGPDGLSEKLGILSEAGGARGTFRLFDAGARVLAFVLEGVIHRLFPFRRAVGDHEYAFGEMHGFSFATDAQAVDLTQGFFSPAAATWREMLEGAVDAPSFHELSCEMLPESRWRPVAHEPRAAIAAHNAPRLAFPSQDGERRGEVLRVRPHPWPTFLGGQYDARAWDALPVSRALPEVGEFRAELTRSVNSVFTVYSVRPSGREAELVAVQANANDQIAFDHAKYDGLTGERRLTVISRRSPVTTFAAEGRPSSAARAEGVGLYHRFVRRLTEELLSYYQFSDRMFSGMVSGPVDLDLELGSRYLYEGHLFYIEGYSHSLTATSASSTVTVTRGLPVEAYEEELPRTLGRKRDDQELSPVFGLGEARKATLLERKRRGL